ncbi:MAG: OadG family protein [Clostridia bacterium]|nr:OadG family protein [Clostridia bacterium]
MNVLAYGAFVAIIGIAVVFIMLTILIFFVWLMGKAFQAITKAAEKKAAEKTAAEAAAKAEAAPAPVVEAPVVEEPAVDDAQLIAVIAAAIAAYDNSGKALVVRKVRRVSGWNNSARSEQVYHF